jgi:DNA-binding CsgD family transcriptional regulator
MKAKKSALAAGDMEAVYALWEGLDRYPADRTDEALANFARAFGDLLGADNVRWLAVVRVLRGAAVQKDRLRGWRMRGRFDLAPVPEGYKKLTAWWFQEVSKLDQASKLDPDFPIGHATPAMIAGMGKFQVHRMRDGWIPFREFSRSEHYRLHYTAFGITDRMWLSMPLNRDAESMFLVDRVNSSVHFSKREAGLAAIVLRGMRAFHRRLFLNQGLLIADEPLSPAARRILQKLLTGMSEKEIASSVGQSVSTTHKYITDIYQRFGVNGRAALMSLWLGS